VAFREGDPRPGLEITLERNCTSAVGELDDHVQPPWRAVRGVATVAVVV